MKRRRALLAGSSFLGVLLSGCAGGYSGGEQETPAYDCDETDRPTSPPSDADLPGGQARYAYPERPDSLSNESTVRTFVTSYERAYRRNTLREDHGSSLDYIDISINETAIHEAPEGAAIVRLTYHYGYGTAEGGDLVHADSPQISVSYYIDDAVLLRAATEGHREDEAEPYPDPVDQGQPVECF